MLYHVSATPGLNLLEPRISTHGKAYVYAVDNLVTGLLFGAKKDDFDFMLYTNEEGIPVIYECYPNAFFSIYYEKRCSVYEVEEEGFLRGMTGWEPELVCEREVVVKREDRIENLYERLIYEELQGNLIANRFEDNQFYKKKISEHVVDRLIRFDLIEHMEKEDERGRTYYKEIITGLKSVMDGHLL